MVMFVVGSFYMKSFTGNRHDRVQFRCHFSDFISVTGIKMQYGNLQDEIWHLAMCHIASRIMQDAIVYLARCNMASCKMQ